MITQTLWIDDEYIYKNFPLPKRLDRGVVYSIIQMEQYTSIQDNLGTCLYEHLEDEVAAQTLDATEQELFKLVQYSLAMYSANGIISFLRTQFGATRIEERQLEQSSLDAISNGLDSKIAYVNKRLKDFIKNNSSIYAIATAAGCTGDLFDEDDTYQGSMFYPADGKYDTNCENLDWPE
jgi:hypothetical protein